VTPWPSEVTAQMVMNFCAGGAAINVLARHVGATVVVVDVGVVRDLEPAPGLIQAKVAYGTADLAVQPAMTLEQCQRALDVGAKVASDLVAGGARCLITGDMGIANTTPSAALISAFTGRPAAEVTGRGTGIDDAMLAHKVSVVEQALRRQRAATATVTGLADPLTLLSGLGGLEIAALAGFITGGAAAKVPVIVDGVIASAALLAAHALTPGVLAYCVAGHRSAEPGASIALSALGLTPLLDLDLRLGEGTGACLALPVVQAAAKILAEMATFDSAGVTQK
jgi:nicotinate-nucleotide--dimethylbenzimidazole phosphoribosyltransferase